MLLDIRGNITDISATCIHLVGIELKTIEDQVVNIHDIISEALYLQDFKDTGKVIYLNRHLIANKFKHTHS